jgi:hypothetical protein
MPTEELHNLYFSPNIIRAIKFMINVARMRYDKFPQNFSRKTLSEEACFNLQVVAVPFDGTVHSPGYSVVK